jgi:hypothetical protein
LLVLQSTQLRFEILSLAHKKNIIRVSLLDPSYRLIFVLCADVGPWFSRI